MAAPTRTPIASSINSRTARSSKAANTWTRSSSRPRSAKPGLRLKPRKVGKRQLAAVDVDTAKLGAAMQRRKHLAGIEQALRVERAFQPLLLVEVDLREHLRHQIAFLDADAVLAGQDAAEFDAAAQD